MNILFSIAIGCHLGLVIVCWHLTEIKNKHLRPTMTNSFKRLKCWIYSDCSSPLIVYITRSFHVTFNNQAFPLTAILLTLFGATITHFDQSLSNVCSLFVKNPERIITQLCNSPQLYESFYHLSPSLTFWCLICSAIQSCGFTVVMWCSWKNVRDTTRPAGKQQTDRVNN